MTIDGGDGDDTLTAPTAPTRWSAALGNDTLSGGDGSDSLSGGDGADTANGNGGDDAVALGAGNDSYTFDPGAGNDTAEGEGDQDSVRFNGSAAVDGMVASAEGGRLRLGGDGSLNGSGLEAVTLDARGGGDTVGVGGGLNGVGVETIDVDLGAGDGAPDLAIVNGTEARRRDRCECRTRIPRPCRAPLQTAGPQSGGGQRPGRDPGHRRRRRTDDPPATCPP